MNNDSWFCLDCNDVRSLKRNGRCSTCDSDSVTPGTIGGTRSEHMKGIEREIEDFLSHLSPAEQDARTSAARATAPRGAK